MKYSNRHILSALNETIFTKHDMKEQYKFSELPLLKNITNMLYKGELEYKKEFTRFMMVRGYLLQLPIYLPIEICNVIQSMKFDKYGARYEINDRTFDIHMYFDSQQKLMHHNIDEQFKKIYIWLYVASYFASPQCSKYVKINIYLTPHKKKLPNRYEIIDKEHANTAFTTSCQAETEIDIFRQEEWFKTLIHETFHNMGMDFSANGSENTNQLLYNNIPINIDFRLYETYTESWAEIIHSLFVAYYHIKKQGSSNIESIFNIVLNNQRRFAVFQCAKVLKHYSMTLPDLYKQNKVSEIRRTNYKENTPIMAYYILKMVVLYNAKDFILWTSKHNKSSINFNHKPNEGKERWFVNFIKRRLNAVTMNEMLEKTRTYLIENSNKKNQITQNLRMTLYELV